MSINNIGVDLTPLQGPHRMRGVGSTISNVLQNFSKESKTKYKFIFYLYKDGAQAALELVGASDFDNHEIRYILPKLSPLPSVKTVRGMLATPERLWRFYNERRHGSNRISDLSDLDAFLQFEQDVIPPHSKEFPVTVIAYDLIPYVMEASYLWSYHTARHEHHYSRRGALLAHLRRRRYISKIRLTAKRATSLIAISEHTKRDFVRYAKVPEKKIQVVHLGVSPLAINSKSPKPKSITRYVYSTWGDIAREETLPTEPFLLFVGGADARRRIADLVSAFNLLRAQGKNIKLVLAGDTMKGINSVPSFALHDALLNSSYRDDIYLLGFVNDEVRDWLYQNAVAFIYPSLYEGFGLPILESMRYGTPVITYRNSSIAEIAGDHVLYATDFTQIASHCIDLLNNPKDTKLQSLNVAYANNYTWQKTAHAILALITKQD